ALFANPREAERDARVRHALAGGPGRIRERARGAIRRGQARGEEGLAEKQRPGESFPRRTGWIPTSAGMTRGQLTGCRLLGRRVDLLVGSLRPAIDGVRWQVRIALFVEFELADHGIELGVVQRFDDVVLLYAFRLFGRLHPRLQRGIGVEHVALRLDPLVLEA